MPSRFIIPLETSVENIFIKSIFASKFANNKICNASKEKTPNHCIKTKYCQLKMVTYNINRNPCDRRRKRRLPVSFFIEDPSYQWPEEAGFKSAHSKQIDEEYDVRRRERQKECDKADH